MIWFKKNARIHKFSISIFILLALWGFQNANSMELFTRWNQKFEKEIVLSCKVNEEEHCLSLCDSRQQCVKKENYCRNCAGTSIYLQKLFTEMGIHFRNTGEQVHIGEVIELLESGDFISLDSKSIYNFVDRYDSPSIRAKFQSLCGYSTTYPTVLLLADPVSRRIGRVKYVVCNEPLEESMANKEEDIRVFRMIDEANILVDGKDND